MKKITATVPVWLTGHKGFPHEKENPERVVSALTYWEPYDENHIPDGWSRVGKAEITVSFIDYEEIISNQVAVLKKAKEKIQAKCQLDINEIDYQIGKLLCIEHKE